MPLQLRQRLAARHIVIPDAVKQKAGKARESLSALWHRDAELVRKKAMKAERHAEGALARWMVRLKPKVVHLEHRLDHAAKALARHSRSRVRS